MTFMRLQFQHLLYTAIHFFYVRASFEQPIHTFKPIITFKPTGLYNLRVVGCVVLLLLLLFVCFCC